MRAFLRDKLAGLIGCSSGNAALLVGLASPVLIGGAGFGVDLAQWYMWKRELQFAVDQAALGGAWAKASNKTADQTNYIQRAQQEYDANIGSVADFDTAPSIGLANYDTGTNNSVLVTASATKTLPFSSLIWDGETTVAVSAQAVWHSSANYSACMFALNEHAAKAFEMGNSVNGSSTCGAGTLSDDRGSQGAMFETGNSAVPLGTLVAEGKIDANFSNNGTLYPNVENLSDPYDNLSPPSSSGQPAGTTYPSTCPVATPAVTTYKADGMTWTHTTYTYKKGAQASNGTVQTNYTGTGYIANGWSPVPQANYVASTGVWSPTSNGTYTNGVAFTARSVTSTDVVGMQAETSAAAGAAVNANNETGNRIIWRIPSTSTRSKYAAITPTTIPANDGVVHLSPGLYTSINITCKTDFSPGIYYVAGGLDFGNNQIVTGSGGVMFVLTNAGAITVNDNSNVTLTGITATTLINNYSMSAADAGKLAGMLIWDPESTADFRLNGNATMHLSGIMYMPQREATFNGNGTAGSIAGNCIMVAADKIKITGNFSLNNFCVTTGGSAMSIGGSSASVKLVA